MGFWAEGAVLSPAADKNLTVKSSQVVGLRTRVGRLLASSQTVKSSQVVGPSAFPPLSLTRGMARRCDWGSLSEVACYLTGPAAAS